jgi:hypothetical protein
MTVAVDKRSLSDDDEKKIKRLLGPAQKGDEKAIAALRPVLDRVGLWQYLGDLTRRVEESWLGAMAGRNALVREAYERKTNEMRRQMLADGDSPLERLLVDRVIATWLQASHADTAYAILLKGDGHSLAEGTYSQQRQDRANARFLKAAKALVTVRRLLVPSVQINVAKNQIISQGAPAVARPELDE